MESSVTFIWTYAGRTRDYVTADIGSDVDLMYEKLLNRIVEQGGDTTVTTIPKPRTFEVSVQSVANSKPGSIVCAKIAFMPLELHIRHAKALVLRSVQCMATSERCSESLLNRPVLEPIGRNARDIFLCATDRLVSDVDVGDLALKYPANPDRISGIIEEGVFHSIGGPDEHDKYTE